MEDDKPNYDDCPAKYLERLKSLINYTGDRGVDDLLAQRQTPKEWLEALTKLDFADLGSVLKLRFDLFDHHVGKFILCTGKDTITVSPHPGAMNVDRSPVVDRDSLHEGLMSLEFFRRAKARTAPADEKAPELSLPSVVLPIGRLHKGYPTESGIKDLEETDYILVVDAITPGHPIWLIWDRQASHEHEIYYVHPDDPCLVFEGVEKNFDAAQILPSINDWFESYGNLDSNQLEESIKTTGLVGFVKAKEVTVAYVNKLLGEAQSQVVTDIMEKNEEDEKDDDDDDEEDNEDNEDNDDNEISDARFAEIRVALGSPFQGKNFCPVSPYEYIRRLEEATAHDNSLDQYLRKATKPDIDLRQSGLEWLQKLAITDFANYADICAHRLHMDCGEVKHFNLVANDEDEFCVGTWPRGLSYEEIDGEAHDALLSLETSALGAGKSLPKLILPVGMLLNLNWSRRETGYAVVIDAVAPGHPVWLIYDRNQDDDLGEERLIVEPANARLVFKGIGHNFDAAQIFPSVQDWIQSYGNVDFAQIEESIKATCITGAVQAKEILLSEAEVLFRQ